MLAGKWFSKIFEPKGLLIDYERHSYEFKCEMNIGKISKVIDHFFSKLGATDLYYTELENAKYNIEIKFGSIDDILITFHIFRIFEDKYIFTICYKSV